MWHSCAERVVFVVFVVHAVQHGVAWMLGVRVCRGRWCDTRLTASGPSRRLPPGGYPVCGAVEDGGAAAHSLGCAGDTLHDTYLRKFVPLTGSNSRNARATSRDPPTATRRVSAFTPRVRSGQCRVAFSLTLSHAFRVRPLRLGATRFAGPRGFVHRWPIPVHPRPARSSTKQFGEVTSSNPSKHIIRAH